jgi:hypothetical protein
MITMSVVILVKQKAGSISVLPGFSTPFADNLICFSVLRVITIYTNVWCVALSSSELLLILLQIYLQNLMMVVHSWFTIGGGE